MTHKIGVGLVFHTNNTYSIFEHVFTDCERNEWSVWEVPESVYVGQVNILKVSWRYLK